MTENPHSPSRFLSSMEPADLAGLSAHLEVLDLPQETVLFEGGDPINAVYFPHSGLVSLVIDLASGQSIEAGMIGSDGVAGASWAAGNTVALNRAVMQVAGRASVLNPEPFRAAVEQSIALRMKVLQHEQFVIAQAQQAAACNASHALESRLCSWILRSRDILRSDDIPLTQEFIAEMLGVQRTSVSPVAHILQQAGLIRYRRGHIRVVDAEGLRESACECYETLRSHADRLLGRHAAP
jgi:CRP-like cAMP-binding protein